jgi:hypothetical protein
LSDGSVKELKRTILHNMAVAPGMDGDLKPADIDAVSAYVWAISHQPHPNDGIAVTAFSARSAGTGLCLLRST